MFKKGKHISPASPKGIGTIIGKGVCFKGVLSFEGYAHIDGNVEGEIDSTGTLVVGDNSLIQADIKVGSLTVGGKICGDITATCRLVMLPTAEVSGKIQAPVLKIEDGAKFKGTCDMKQDTKETKSISYWKSTTVKKAGSQDQSIPQKKAA
jgi:cytoskeletal protein CcmA (bactofilin family)